LRTVTNRFSSGETAKYLRVCKIVPAHSYAVAGGRIARAYQ